MDEYYGMYHVYNKSIAQYVIFNTAKEYNRFVNVLLYYQYMPRERRYSDYIRERKTLDDNAGDDVSNKTKIVNILAYCIMPTHIHLILYPNVNGIISSYVQKVLNSYSKYFNLSHKRKGPLWQGKTKQKLIKTHEQLLHLTRYVHLNPVTACLTERAEEWPTSSYREYIEIEHNKICDRMYTADISPKEYKEFTEERKHQQRSLAILKDMLLD